MFRADLRFGLCPEDKLLSLFQETAQRVQEVLHSESSNGAERPGSELNQAAEHPSGHEDSASVLRKLFWLLKEWSVLHAPRVGFLRGELNTTADTLAEGNAKSVHKFPERETRAAQGGISRDSNFYKHGCFTEIILNVLEDAKSVEEKLFSITSNLDKAIAVLSGPSPPGSEANDETMVDDLAIHINTTPQGSLDLQQTPSVDPCVPQKTDSDYISNASHCAVSEGDSGQQHPEKLCNNGLNVVVRGQDTGTEEDVYCGRMRKQKNNTQRPLREDNEEVKKEAVEEGGGVRKTEKANEEDKRKHVSWTDSWITVGLADSSSSSPKAPVICYITAPPEVTEVITCKVVDGLSSLMVSGSEELVSSVIRIENSSSTKGPFPLTIAVPFRACYRGNYREITVKVVDREQRVSYVTPTSTEGTYGGHRGSFAVVRVYTLGVFAVLSHLQRDTFTIPKRGLSIKLTMDSRICLDYLPGSFSTPVVAQAMVQPVDAMLLSTLKWRNDSHHSIVTTSPLLYLHHPSTVTPRRPLTLTLPCPLNPDKRKTGERSNHTHSSTVTENISPHRVRVLSASVKSSKELSKEQLAVLGWRDEQWNVLDKVSVRNLQNGLVSFELTKHYERLIVVRLSSSVRPSYLVYFAEDLEESVRICTVTVVLQTKQQDPNSVVLAALPSRELSRRLDELQAQAYCGPPEPCPEISLREGDQLLVKFGGNISSTGDQVTMPHTLTLHTQRRNWLYLQLKEVDPFGNYSSPHYKGTVLLFRIPREQLLWRGDRALMSEHYCLEEPVCKLPVTLPKIVKMLSRPVSAKVLRPDQAEPLCDGLLAWLSAELSEEDVTLLVMCLRLRRSTVQLARLRAPDSLALQTFHVLATWRRALPSSTPKRPLLARFLTHIGRPELAAELLRRGPAACEGERGGAAVWRLSTLERPVTVHDPLHYVG